MRALENAVLAELRKIENNPKIRKKDIMEWSTGSVEPHEGEKLVRLTLSEFGNQPIQVAYKEPEKK
jgi:hypothetical protein